MGGCDVSPIRSVYVQTYYFRISIEYGEQIGAACGELMNRRDCYTCLDCNEEQTALECKDDTTTICMRCAAPGRARSVYNVSRS